MDVVCGVAGGLGVVLLGLSPIFIYHIAVRRRRRNKRGVWSMRIDKRDHPSWHIRGAGKSEGVVWMPNGQTDEWEGLVFDRANGTTCVGLFEQATRAGAMAAVIDEMDRRGYFPAEEVL